MESDYLPIFDIMKHPIVVDDCSCILALLVLVDFTKEVPRILFVDLLDN